MKKVIKQFFAKRYHLVLLYLARWRLRGNHPHRDLTSVSIVSDLSKANGIARGALLQHEAADRAGFETQIVDVSEFSKATPWRPVEHRRTSAYIFHVGAPETSALVHSVLPEARTGWRIGYWAWELPEAPAEWKNFEALVHEVWTPSTFSANALRKLLEVPVKVVPHEIPQQPRRQRPRGGFTVLAMADGRSSLTRKNPLGALECFKRAFAGAEDCKLVLKLNAPTHVLKDLRKSAEGLPNVEFLLHYLSDDEMDALYLKTDVLLSLHRSEGFGLPMREAMARGIPVVGTGWSGNTDFMSPDNALLVPYTLVPAEDESGIYGHGSVWAEPDVAAGADALRKLYLNPQEYERIATAAHGSALEALTHFRPDK